MEKVESFSYFKYRKFGLYVQKTEKRGISFLRLKYGEQFQRVDKPVVCLGYLVEDNLII
jgi:hypothetical protein